MIRNLAVYTSLLAFSIGSWAALLRFVGVI